MDDIGAVCHLVIAAVDDIGAVFYLIVAVLIGLGALVRKLLEKLGEGAKGGPGPGPKPRQEGRNVGNEIKEFLDKLGQEFRGEEPRRPAAPARPQAQRPANQRGHAPARPQRRPPSPPPQRRQQPRQEEPAAEAALGPGVAEAVRERAPGTGRKPARGATERPQRSKASRGRYPSPVRFAGDLPFGGISPERIREAVVWSEILGKPRAMRPHAGLGPGS